MKYQKPALSIPDQIARWQAKGLSILDITAAERALTYIGYFRLRGYALPLMQVTPQGRQFLPGVGFDQILDRYQFDRELRRLVLGEIERIEVAVRTVISNTQSQTYGPFWYFNHPDQVLGHAPGQHGRPEPFGIGGFLSEVERETRRSKDQFAQHYYSKYTEPLLPPSWLMAECVSFGKWSKIYQHLKKADPNHPNPKKVIAKAFGLQVTVMESWLHGLTILRNLCAHHGRVWNRRFSYRPEVFSNEAAHFTHQQSFYCYAVVIRLLTRAVDPADDWPQQLAALFAAHPGIAPADLGFPTHWQNAPLWN